MASFKTLILILLLAKIAFTAHNSTKPQPNSRGKEMNRDLSNGLQYGFEMGLLKFSQAGAPDCTTSGMSVLRSAIKMFKKYYDSGM